MPKVLGGATTDVTIDFSIRKEFDLGDVDLVMGETGRAQVRVPLSGKGDVVTLMPTELDPPAPIVMGQVQLVTDWLRRDFVSAGYSSKGPPKGSAYVTGRIRIQRVGGFREAIRINGEDFQLVVPGGGATKLVEFSKVYENADDLELKIQFEVPDDALGQATFKVVMAEPATSGEGAFELKDDGSGTGSGSGAGSDSRPTRRGGARES
jgi:hypothetical protein